VVGLSATVASAAEYALGYTQAGEWFDPGEGHGSGYDGVCGRWFENNFPKATNAWGLITFIDTSGGWNYSKQGYGVLGRTLTSVHWTKKMHCKNNSGTRYQGGCWGYYRTYPCA
jgi:hypothetical protein